MTELYIFSQDDKLLTIISEETGLTSAPLRDELNQVASEPFIFTVEADVNRAKFVKEENRVVLRDIDGDLREYVIKELDDVNGMDGPETQATCIPSFLEELSNKTVVDRRFVKREAQEALNAALEGTRFTGIVEVSLGLATTNFYYISSVDAVWETRNTWGGDIKAVVYLSADKSHIAKREMRLKQRLGTDKGHRFEIDHNMEQIERTVLSYPVTALYGRGSSLEIQDDEGEATGGHTRYIDFADVEWKVSKGDPVDKPLGQKWVGDPKALLIYGYKKGGQLLHLEGIFSNQDYEDPEELLWATWQHLQIAQHPEVNYKLSVDLLEKKASLGDGAVAIDREFARPIEIQTRIIAIQYDLLDIEGTTIVEMGQFLSVNEDNTARDIEDIKEKINQPRPTKPIDGSSFPDIVPGIPVNIEAVGGFQAIQLYWDYDSKVYISHYEVYGSQVADYVPDTQHLLYRGRVSAFVHTVETDQTWYYYLRAVNTRGTPSGFSQRVEASSVRVISDDIQFGPEIAEELRELSKVAELLSEQSKNNIRKPAIEHADEQANQARIAAVQAAAIEAQNKVNTAKIFLEADIATKVDATWVNGQLVTKSNITDTYTKTQVDNAVNSKVSTTTYTTDRNGIVTRLDSAESRITQTETNITSKVSSTTYTADKTALQSDINSRAKQSDLTATNTRMSSAESTITQQAGQIESKVATITYTTDKTALQIDINGRAKQGDLTATNTRVSTAESSITQQAGQIASKVEQATFNALNTRVSTAESSITQQAGLIASKVTQTDVNNAIKADNTLLDTRADNQLPSWYFTNYPRQVISEFKQRTVLGVTGSSTYGTLTTNVPWNGISGGVVVQEFRSSDGTFERKGNTGATAWLAWIQLEDVAGSQAKVTAGIAPVNTRLTTAESSITQQAGQIASKVSQTDFNGNTVASLINQTATTIKIKAENIDLIGDVSIINGRTQISNLAVGTAAIANLAVTNAKIGLLAIGTAQMDNLAVTNAKIANLAVDDAKIASLSVTKLLAGTIDTSKIKIRGGSAIDYTLIDGSLLESRGKFTRTWLGLTNTHDVKLKLEKGYFRARNDSLDRSLYLSDFGISTYVDGNGDYMDENGSSGSIFWWDKTYSPSGANGLTLNSHGGVVAIESNLNRVVINAYTSASIESRQSPVYLRPHKDNRAGLNTFGFHVSENTNAQLTDGFLMFGADDTKYGSGLRFSKTQTGRPMVAVVNQNMERGADTTLDSGHVWTNDIRKRDGSGNGVYWNGTSTGTLNDGANPGNTLSTSGIISNRGDKDIHIGTRSSGSVRITNEFGFNSGNAITYRPIAASAFNTASSIIYKTNIEELKESALSIIKSLKVVEYDLKDDLANGIYDNRQVGFIAEHSVDIATSDQSSINLYKITSYNTRAIQEVSTQVDTIADDVNWLKMENQQLRQRISKLENAA